jgi:hypothetical protein
VTGKRAHRRRARRDALANIVVNVELRDGRPTAPSTFALGEARRVAHTLGATVYALVVGEAMLPLADTLAEPLGRAGADKVLLLADPLAAACPVEPLWRDVLEVIAERLAPRLFLFPAGSVGLQLGPLLAVRLGASFLPRAALDLGERGPTNLEGEPRLSIRRWSDRQDGFFTAGIGAAFAPMVVTLGAGGPPLLQGGGPAELSVLHEPRTTRRPVEILSSEPAPQASAELASTVVIASVEPGEAALPTTELRPDVLVLGDSDSLDLLEHASPRLVLLLSARGNAAALTHLKLSPDAHVVALSSGRGSPRGPLQGPLVDRLWKIDRPHALARVGVAITAAPSTKQS